MTFVLLLLPEPELLFKKKFWGTDLDYLD